MKRYTIAAAALTAAASTATAGGVERRGDPSMILFEEGKNYLEFSAATVHPSVSGTALPTIPVPGATPTGNMTRSYESVALGYKHQLTEKFSLAFVIDEPVGASVNYQTAPYTGPGTGAVFGGSNAEVNSKALTAMAKYKINDRFSIYGGLRYQSLKGKITVISPGTGPASGPGVYNLNVDNDYQLGYLAGAAYEIPDIALRVALTYESKIEHEFRDNNGTPFDVEIPQAVTLHAQSGIAKDTLLFGSVRWREWTKFDVQPADFFSYATGGPVNTAIASGTSDVWTYELGLGRRFNENWSGAVTLGYEKDNGDIVGNLSGTDGYFSYGLGATYETESWEVTTGVRYIDIGSANTNVTSFTDNDAIAFGTKLAWRF